MTPSELKDLLYEYDKGRIKASQQAADLHNFGIWWWDEYLTEKQRDVIRPNPSSCWEDLRQLPDEELILLWAVFKM